MTDAAGGLLIVLGTRPECLKLAPVVRALRAAGLPVLLLNTGQQQAMVDEHLADLGLAADAVFPQLPPLSLPQNVRTLQQRIEATLTQRRCALAVVQGDTTSAFAGARAAVACGVPVAHVEAGLRTAHANSPFPEEWFRRRITRHAALHFAPTPAAAQRLLDEGVAADRVHMVGNTIVDLLRERIAALPPRRPADAPLIVMTIHRRENQGVAVDAICDGVLDALRRQPDARLIALVHPNPRVSARLRRRLADHPRIELQPPQRYSDFIALLYAATLVITDSGGIQEEAPYLGAQVLLVRANTERPEAEASGYVARVPADAAIIAPAVDRLLRQPPKPPVAFDADAPFGDGRAAERIAEVVRRFLAGGMRSAHCEEPSIRSR